jgi:hypothetical protein
MILIPFYLRYQSLLLSRYQIRRQHINRVYLLPHLFICICRTELFPNFDIALLLSRVRLLFLLSRLECVRQNQREVFNDSISSLSLIGRVVS